MKFHPCVLSTVYAFDGRIKASLIAFELLVRFPAKLLIQGNRKFLSFIYLAAMVGGPPVLDDMATICPPFCTCLDLSQDLSIFVDLGHDCQTRGENKAARKKIQTHYQTDFFLNFIRLISE